MPDIEYYDGAYTGEQIDEAIGRTIGGSNPNILDNWYFVGGGSQNGTGKFPINQRRTTTYNNLSALTMGVDRWIFSAGSYEVAAQGFKINGAISEFFELDRAPLGQYYTISALFSDNTFWTATGVVTSFSTNLVLRAGENGSNQVALKGATRTSGNTWQFAVWNSNTARYLVAVKLERGITQTLAHKENNVWKLNEIPNFQQELAKCQHYFTDFYAANNAFIGLGYAQTTTTVRFIVALPVPMVKDANTQRGGATPTVYQNAGGASRNATACTLLEIVGNIASFEVTVSGSTVGEFVRIILTTGSHFNISNDL